jgi:predicted ATPase
VEERRCKELASIEIAATLVRTVYDYGRGELDYAADEGTEDALFPTGSTVNGRYRVLNLLGSGGMGVVYEVADNLHPNRQVALKVVRHQILRPVSVGLFKAEFQAMAGFQHPNLASVFDFEAVPGSDSYLYTMEYVRGADLSVATAGLGWQAILDLVVQVCRALGYVHSRGVVHHDLKPGNVLVSGDGHVKVLDFGLVGAVAGQMYGTPAYLAPELAGEKTADHRADLYSLGILTYELLCRRHPFPTHNLVQLLHSHRTATVEFPDQIREELPAWLVAMVHQLVAKRPDDRFRTANAVIEFANTQGGLSYEVETRETRDSYVVSSRFVGRGAELAELQRFVARRTGEEDEPVPPLALVAGHAGMGKSRTLREVRHHAQLSRLPFFEVSCCEAAVSELGPVEEATRFAVGVAEAVDAIDLIRQHGPELGKLHPGLEAQYGIARSRPVENAEANRLRLVDQLCQFLVHLARRAPLVLCFNDLQWAGTGSVAVLGHLARTVAVAERAGQRVPIALLGSFREDEIGGRPIESMIRKLEGRGEVEVVRLAPLDRDDVGEMLGSMLGLAELPRPFVDRVYDETEGNPFFVAEVMRELVEQGAVYLREGAWEATSEVGALDIPRSVSDVLLRRVSFLDDAERTVLELLAVAGRPVTASLLLRAGPFEDASLHRAIGGLARRQMAVRVMAEEACYRVDHHGLRETLVAASDPAHRRDLHRRLGEAIEQGSAEERDAGIYQLAYHFAAADDPDRALKYSLKAGEKAWEGYANDLAVGFFSQARELIAASDPTSPLLVELQEKMGDCYVLQGRYTEAKRCYEDLATSAATPHEQARLLRKVGEVFIQQDEAQGALDAIWRSVELLGESRPASSAARGVSTLANLQLHLVHRFAPRLGGRELDEAEKKRMTQLGESYLRLCYAYHFVDPSQTPLLLLRAANAAERSGDAKIKCHAYASLSHLYAVASQFGSAIDYGCRAVMMAEDLGSPWHVAVAESRLGIAHYLGGSWRTALVHLQPAREAFLRCGDLFELGACYTHIYACFVNEGRLADAADLVREQSQILQRTGERQFMLRSAPAQLAYVEAKLGKVTPEQALADLDRVITQCETARDLLAHSALSTLAGDLHLSTGDLAGAASALERGLAVREANSVRLDYGVASYSLLARAYMELALRRGEPLRSATAARQRSLRRLVRTGLRLTHHRHPNYRSQALLSSAMYEALQGNPTRAAAVFAQSRQAAERLRATTWLAEAHLVEARCLAQLGPVDHGRIRDNLDRALTLFECSGDALGKARVLALLQDPTSIR